MKKHLFLLFFIACFSSNLCTAQIEDFQDLNKIKQLSDKELVEEIEECLRSSPELTDFYIDILLDRASKQLHNLHLAKSYFYYGYVADVKGEYKKAEEYVYMALSVDLNNKESEFLFRIYSLRGKLREQYGKNEAALDDFKTSLRISKKYNNDIGKANAIANLGKMHRKADEYHKALEYSKKAYAIAMKPLYDDEISRINIIMGVGGANLKLKRPDSAIVYINKGIKRSLDYGDTEGVSYFYIDYGIANFIKKEYIKARDYFEKAEEIIQGLANEKRLIEVYYYIAKCQYELRDYEQSIFFIEKAFAVIDEENEGLPKGKEYVPDYYVDILKLLIKNHRELGNNDQLAYYTETHFKAEEKEEQKDEYIRSELYNYLPDDKAESIKEFAKKEKKSLQLIKNLKIFSGILLLIFIIGCFLFYRNQQKKKARFRELNIKIAALKYEQRLNIEEQTQSKKEKEIPQPKKEVVITDKKVTAILESLKKFEQQEHFLDTNCNLRFVAKKVKTNATYLSKIINTDKGVSFNEYITELRMQYTLKRLQNDPLFRAYSIKSIAQEVGYKSADSFTKHFKNYTQLYPSYYIKSLKKST